ncbi:MAG: Uncharacterised protein [Flavobacteriia bacterium]|nr:MAG: Uncharacterised protein [Flavobacteriia bacterium]
MHRSIERQFDGVASAPDAQSNSGVGFRSQEAQIHWNIHGLLLKLLHSDLQGVPSSDQPIVQSDHRACTFFDQVVPESGRNRFY